MMPLQVRSTEWCCEMVEVDGVAVDRDVVSQGDLRRFRVATAKNDPRCEFGKWIAKDDHLPARFDDSAEAEAYATWAQKRLATRDEQKRVGDPDEGVRCAMEAQTSWEQVMSSISTPVRALAAVEQRLRALPRHLFVGVDVPHPDSHAGWFHAQTACWGVADKPRSLDPDDFKGHVFCLDGRTGALHLLHGYFYGGQLLNLRRPPSVRPLQSEVYSLENIIYSRRPFHDVLLEGLARIEPVRWSIS